MQESRLVQQGDVLFYEIDKLPKDIMPTKPMRDGIITFAEGESTGHHHSCSADGVILFEDPRGIMWCSVNKEVVVTHQEHKPVILTPGNYRVGIVREYDPFETVDHTVID